MKRMLFHRLSRLGFVLLLVLAGGAVLAQSTGSDQPPGTLAAPIFCDAQMTGDDILPIDDAASVESALVRMRGIHQRITGLYATSCGTHDMIMATCVNDKLDKMKRFLDAARGARAKLQAAKESGDVAAQAHEIKRIDLSYRELQRNACDAATCVGDDMSFRKDSVEVIRPSDLNINTTINPELPDISDIQPPPPASPFI